MREIAQVAWGAATRTRGRKIGSGIAAALLTIGVVNGAGSAPEQAAITTTSETTLIEDILPRATTTTEKQATTTTEKQATTTTAAPTTTTTAAPPPPTTAAPQESAAPASTARPAPAAKPAPATTAKPAPAARSGNCHAAYPDVCIPPAPPDLDCKDVPHRRFRVVQHPDPHGFDADNDGIGCESG